MLPRKVRSLHICKQRSLIPKWLIISVAHLVSSELGVARRLELGRTFVHSSLVFTISTPHKRSECPPKYLVPAIISVVHRMYR